MSFHIRPFMPGDYAALSAISLAVHPDYVATEDEMRYWDEHRDPAHKFLRLVAEQDTPLTSFCAWWPSRTGALSAWLIMINHSITTLHANS